MKPTVGRIVHFGFRASNSAPVETIPAIVTGVLPDYGTQPVNLQTFPNQTALPSFVASVAYGTAEDGLSPKSDCWCWPPKVN